MVSTLGAVRLRYILAVATLLGFFSAFVAFNFVATFGDPSRPRAPFPFFLLLNLNYWYSWAVIAPAILWLTRRFPLDRATWKRSVPVHVVGVVFGTLTHITLVVGGRWAIYTAWGMAPGTLGLEAQRMVFLNFDFEMMTYWTIVGLGHAHRYFYESQDRALRASRLETRLIEAQLQTLQRQLQPHFLFNTLNSISTLMHRNVDGADAMLARLGDLLRQSFENVGVQEVALSQELDFLRKYVDIERARFEERLSVTFDTPPDTLDCLVPNLLLQPLVENAIRHGIGPRVGAGHVLVRAARVGTDLEIEVRDDGVGVPAERRHELAQGVGLTNTRSRLAHMYGSRHRFGISTPPGGGLAVQIRIPIDEVAIEATDADIMEGVA